PEWLFAWFGAALIGAVDVGVNVDYRGAGLARLIRLSGARVVVVDGLNLPNLVPVAAELEAVEAVVHVDGTAGASPAPGAANLEVQGLVPATAEPVVAAVDVGDLAKLVFTSGTTGAAKAVALSHSFCIDFSTE